MSWVAGGPQHASSTFALPDASGCAQLRAGVSQTPTQPRHVLASGHCACTGGLRSFAQLCAGARDAWLSMAWAFKQLLGRGEGRSSDSFAHGRSFEGDGMTKHASSCEVHAIAHGQVPNSLPPWPASVRNMSPCPQQPFELSDSLGQAQIRGRCRTRRRPRLFSMGETRLVHFAAREYIYI